MPYTNTRLQHLKYIGGIVETACFLFSFFFSFCARPGAEALLDKS